MLKVRPCGLDGADDWAGVDWDYAKRNGLVLQPVAYAPPSSCGAVPIATFDAFAGFIAAWRANDPNGTWGDVLRGTDAEGQLYLVHVSGDAWHDGDEDAPGPAVWGLTDIDLDGDTCRIDPHETEPHVVDYWPAGEGGMFALDGWVWTEAPEDV